MPGVSDTFKAAVVSFNRVYRNSHVAQVGDTLNALAVQYYGSTAQAHMIYLRNSTVLATADANAQIPPGTQVDVGTGPTVWDRVGAGATR